MSEGTAVSEGIAAPCQANAATWLGFILMCLGMFMAILDIQVVATSLPAIQQALEISRDAMSWIRTAYLIAEIIAIPLTGWLTRVLTLRWLFVGAISLFTLASIGCAFSGDFATLVCFRVLQGFAGGTLIPAVFSAVFLLFPLPQHPIATTMAGIMAVLAPTVGPVVGGWITSVCIHEFGHALVAYLGGDRSVAAAGYLTLNPLKYTHPLLSIVLPLVFLFLGGFGLPGGAVYLDQNAMRSDRWRAFASAAGPLSNLLFAAVAASPFLLHLPDAGIGNERFYAALAFLVFLQFSAIILNLLPIPPFDGFGIIAPWLSIELRVFAQRIGMLPLLLLSFFLWQGGPLSAVFWNAVYSLTGVLQVPLDLVEIGRQQFLP